MLSLPNATAERRCAAFDVRPLRWRVPVICEQDDGPGRQSICGACLLSPRGARAEPRQQPYSLSAEHHIRTDACSHFFRSLDWTSEIGRRLANSA